ncbi:hypothetical protein YC2023_002296 [Brassica napus]
MFLKKNNPKGMNRFPSNHLPTLYIPHLSCFSPSPNSRKKVIRAINDNPN